MSQRIALAIAAALTAFALVVVGGLATRLSSAQPEPTLAIATEAPPVAATSDPAVQAAIAERDAAYQQALAEANARIEAANAQVRAANAQIEVANTRVEQANTQVEQANARPAALAAPAVVAAPAAPAPTEAPLAPPSYPISAEQAATLAQAVAYGAAPSKAAELVSLQGTPAYEVTFPNGLVYIDANTGAVLASSIPAPAPPAPRYEDGNGEHEEREHEEREHQEYEAHVGGEQGGGDHD